MHPPKGRPLTAGCSGVCGWTPLPGLPLLLLLLPLTTLGQSGGNQGADGRPGAVWAFGLLKSSVTVPPAALQDVSSLAASGNTAVAIRSNGSLVTWGNSLDVDIVRVASTSLQGVGVSTLSISLSHAVALLKNGTIIAYGSNGYGQLDIPAELQNNPDVINVGASAQASFAMLRNGRCIAWGYTQGMPELFNIKQIAGNSLIFTMALTEDGRVLQWQHPTYRGSYIHPPVPPAAATGVQQITTGLTRSLALVNGGVVSWGDDTTNAVPEVAKSGVQAIASGNLHDLALLSNGTVVAWGQSAKGATIVPAEATTGIRAVASGSDFSLALKGDSVVAWGDTEVWMDASEAIPADLLASTDIQSCSAGRDHVLCLKADGTVAAFGNDASNQTFITREIARARFKAVAAGDGYSMGVTVGGAVRSWGPNGLWQPPVQALSNVSSVTASDDYACAVLESGGLVSWGDRQVNTSGLPEGAVIKAISAKHSNVLVLLDNGTVVSLVPGNPGVPTIFIGDAQDTYMNRPAEVAAGVRAVAAGAEHSLALLDNGTVVAWGVNDLNQTTIHGLSGVKAIAAGDDHSVAVLDNGTVRVFGDTLYKQNQVPPQALAGVLDVTAGATFTVVIYDPAAAVPTNNPSANTQPGAARGTSGIIDSSTRGTATSSTTSRKLSPGAIAGIVIGLTALLLLLLALVAFKLASRRGRRWRGWKYADRLLSSYKSRTSGASITASASAGGSGYGKEEHVGAPPEGVWVLTATGQVPTYQIMSIPGLQPGEVFTRATAHNYQWAAVIPDAQQHVPVEAGINDMQLDNMVAKEGGGAGGSSPAVELTSAQVRQQIQLLKDGLLGRGATGLVFSGLWPSRFGPNALLAIKVLKDGYEMDVETLQSFAYETGVLAMANHPNVVKLYGYCLEPPTVCLILELLPFSLKDLLYNNHQQEQHPKPLLGLPGATSQTLDAPPPGCTLDAHSSVTTGRCSPAGTSTTYSVLDRAQSLAQDTRGSGGTDASCILQHRPSPKSASASQALMSAAPSTSRWSYTGSSAAWLSGLVKRPTMLQVLQISTDIAAGLSYLHEKPAAPSISARINSPGGGGAGAAAPSVGGGAAAGPPSVGAGGSGSSVDGGGSQEAPQSGHMEERSSRIVHRDLKPANILINSQGRAVISDFGLARQHANTTVETERVGAGTLPYMAPELLTSAYGGGLPQPITNRVDVYSVGLIIWEMLSGQPPWKGCTQMAVVAAVTGRRRPELPDLHKRPSSRPDARTSLDGVAGEAGSSLAGAASGSGAGGAKASPEISIVGGEEQSVGPLTQASLFGLPELNDIIKQCWEHRELRRPTATQLYQMLWDLSQRYSREASA